jgi:hypothetical protein
MSRINVPAISTATGATTVFTNKFNRIDDTDMPR